MLEWHRMTASSSWPCETAFGQSAFAHHWPGVPQPGRWASHVLRKDHDVRTFWLARFGRERTLASPLLRSLVYALLPCARFGEEVELLRHHSVIEMKSRK